MGGGGEGRPLDETLFDEGVRCYPDPKIGTGYRARKTNRPSGTSGMVVVVCVAWCVVCLPARGTPTAPYATPTLPHTPLARHDRLSLLCQNGRLGDVSPDNRGESDTSSTVLGLSTGGLPLWSLHPVTILNRPTRDHGSNLHHRSLRGREFDLR